VQDFPKMLLFYLNPACIYGTMKERYSNSKKILLKITLMGIDYVLPDNNWEDSKKTKKDLF
jgi:hypothetical protein